MSLNLRETVVSLEKSMEQAFLQWATKLICNIDTSPINTSDNTQEEGPPHIQQIIIATLRISKLHHLLQVEIP